MWEAKPLHYDGMIIGNSVYAVKDGLGTSTQIGVIFSSHSTLNSKAKMRYVKIEGTNGARYHGRYCEAKGNIVSLKRTADAHARYERQKASRQGSKERHKYQHLGEQRQSLARIKKFNFGKRCEKTPS